MPTVLRLGPYRFFFYSNENAEPAHIHIQREKMLAKLWLKPVALASSTRFAPKELKKSVAPDKPVNAASKSANHDLVLAGGNGK